MTRGTRALGAHTFGLAWDMDATTAVEMLAAHGFRSFEFIAMAPHLDPRRISAAETARLRRAVDSVQGEVLALDLPSNDINIASTSPDVVDFNIESYIATIRLAGEIGSRWVVVLPGRRHMLLPPPDERLKNILRRAMERLLPHAERAGVRLLLENHPQTLLPDAVSMAGYIKQERYGSVDALYDVANGFAIGEDTSAALSVLQSHLGMVHLSDSPTGQWKHDPIGSGAIDFRSILKTLERIGFDGPIVTEIIAPDALSQLVIARESLRDLGWPFEALA